MDNFGVTATAPVMIEGAPSGCALAQNRRAGPGSIGLRLAGPTADEARRSFIGGSDANIIFSGDGGKVLRLWREKRGEAEPEDLSGVLPVMLGCWSEPFNRQWFEKLSGERCQEVGEHCCLAPAQLAQLHARRLGRGVRRIFEAKHTSAFAKLRAGARALHAPAPAQHGGDRG